MPVCLCLCECVVQVLKRHNVDIMDTKVRPHHTHPLLTHGYAPSILLFHITYRRHRSPLPLFCLIFTPLPSLCLHNQVGERGDDLQSFLEEAPNQFDQVTKKTIKKKEDILPLQVRLLEPIG